MRRLTLGSVLAATVVTAAALTLPGGAAAESLNTVVQHHSFGTIAPNSTICIGPIGPSTTEGVQIFGYTNGAANLTWQVYSVSSQSAPTLVFQSTGTSVSQTITPSGNLLYHACVKKTNSGSEDYDLTLNSQPLG